MANEMIAVVDGRAVASSGGADDPSRVALLTSVLRSLERFGYDVILVLDEELRLEIERSESCRKCLERVTLSLTPPGADRDEIALTLADETGAALVSNDHFEAYLARFPWLAERRIPYRIHRGRVYLDPEELMGVF